MMILRLSWLLATLVPYVFADVKFTSPAAGATLSGPTISITWEESGNSPKISELASYQIFLCAGGNDASSFTPLTLLVTTRSFAKGNSATGTITPGLGANVKNAYFLKIISAATGGSVINYSDRFSISGMTGVFSDAVTAGLKKVSGTAGPPTENDIQAVQQPAAGGAAPAVAGGEYTVAYTLQTGSIRYAPMPPMPVTHITAKGQSRLWPSSAYTVYPGPAGSPNAITTNSMYQTFSASSVENTAAAAEQPTDTAMARFLNRWKD